MRHLPGRCHELKGDREGELTLDLVHPTPIFEAIFSFSVAAFLGWFDSRRRLKPGSLIALFFVLHGLGRFSIEWIRRNPRYWFGEGFMHRIELDEYLQGAT